VPVRWDEQLLADQMRFLDAQAELGITGNVAWGLFIDRAWPVPLANGIGDRRAALLAAFTEAAHARAWRTAARILSSPLTAPEAALAEAAGAVYGVTGSAREALADWFARGEAAYFSRAGFEVGRGSLSLEPLIGSENPAAAGPAIYLRDRMSAAARADYARDLERLKDERVALDVPRREVVAKTISCIDGTLGEIAALG
jgi:hypothetical protein